MGNSNSRLGGRRLDLPGATRAQSEEFTKRFYALPVEIQIMIITYTVTEPQQVDPSGLGIYRSRRRACGSLVRNKTLRIEAYKEYERRNTFRVHLDFFDISLLTDNIRDLVVDYSIIVQGGDVMDLTTFKTPQKDIDKINALPTIFPQLEKLELRVTNTGEIARKAHYTSMPALAAILTPIPTLEQIIATEKTQKMQSLIIALMKLNPPRTRRNVQLRKRVRFLQHDDGESCEPLVLRSQCICTGDQSETSALAFQILLMLPHSLVYAVENGEAASEW